MDSITLVGEDGIQVEASRPVIEMFETLKMMYEDVDDLSTGIPIPKTNGQTLQKIVDWSAYHVDHRDTTEYDDNFFDIPFDELGMITISADFLNNKPLLEATCQSIAKLLETKGPHEVQTMLTGSQ